MAAPLQLGFTDYEQIDGKTRTRRQRFWDEMEITVPWEAFLALIEPVYCSEHRGHIVCFFLRQHRIGGS